MMANKRKPLSERIKENPHELDSLFASLGPEKIRALVDSMNFVNDERDIRRQVDEAAASAPDNETMAVAVEEFRACFDRLTASQDARSLAIGAVEAAFVIMSLAPLDAETIKGIVSKKLSSNGTVGGRKSGVVRRAKREWITHAEELIKQFVDANEEASQDTIATEVSNGWKLEKPRAPSHATLKKHVAHMQSNGTIPRPAR